MTDRLALALCLAFVWGVIWALFLQFHRYGRWLAVRRTWITVVVGVGVDLALLALLLNPYAWATVATVVAASSVGVIVRSLVNEHSEDVQ